VSLVTGDDDRDRCSWGAAPPEYRAYHDDEWGRPVTDDVRIYEKLCLEGFQSGLSWLTILRKREGFRAAFARFDPERVAAFGPADVERLLGDAGIVRHRGKIEATIANARALLDLWGAGLTLGGLLWSHEPQPSPAAARLSDLPATTAEATALSKALRGHGFRFVGPTTAYSAMQSLGVVNDHLAGCHVREAVEEDRRKLVRPG
jgi:DNA-3-methyladenine glycosylase I